MKRHVSPCGTALVVALLMIVVAAGIGFAGWRVWQSSQLKATKSASSSSAEQANSSVSQPLGNVGDKRAVKTEADASAPYKGLRIWSTDESYSFVLPNGWSALVCSGGANNILVYGTTTADDLAYDAKLKPVATMSDCGKDGPQPFTVYYVANRQQIDGSVPDGQRSDFASVDGLSGVLYDTAYQGGEPLGISLADKGDKQQTYIFAAKDGTYYATYFKPAARSDQSDFVAKVVQTLKFYKK